MESTNSIEAILEKINNSIQELISKRESEKPDQIRHESSNNIVMYFDRIHDKLFNLNSALLAAYIVLGTFPVDSPIISFYWISAPTIIMAYLIYLEYKQLKRCRHEANIENWKDNGMMEHINNIKVINYLSILALILTFLCFAFIIFKVINSYSILLSN